MKKMAWSVSIDKGRSTEETKRSMLIQGTNSASFLNENAMIVGGLPDYLWNMISSPIVRS